MGFLTPFFDVYTSYNAFVAEVIFHIITGFNGFENLNWCVFIDSDVWCGIKIP